MRHKNINVSIDLLQISPSCSHLSSLCRCCQLPFWHNSQQSSVPLSWSNKIIFHCGQLSWAWFFCCRFVPLKMLSVSFNSWIMDNNRKKMEIFFCSNYFGFEQEEKRRIKNCCKYQARLLWVIRFIFVTANKLFWNCRSTKKLFINCRKQNNVKSLTNYLS